MVAATTLSTVPARRLEQRIAMEGVPWKTYVLLREAIDDPYVKMTYCEGVLELTTPSEPHELSKTLLARLVELFAFLTHVPLVGYGSTTFRKEAKARGLEPDECYLLGREAKRGALPDFAIEVIEQSPLLDKLTVYDGLEIPEVWLLENGKLSIYRRKTKGGYMRARRSVYLPRLDPRLLARYVGRTDHDAALHEFAARVKGVKKRSRR